MWKWEWFPGAFSFVPSLIRLRRSHFERSCDAGEDRVSYEVNSIGATGVKLPLLGKTTICIGEKIGQSAPNPEVP
jgi:hypothetical protein